MTTEKNILETALDRIDQERATESLPVTERRQFVVVPAGHSLEPIDLERDRDHPIRATGTKEFSELASFLAYVNEYKGDTTLIDLRDDHALATFNHHKPGGPAGWCDHRAKFEFHKTDEYLTWSRHNGDRMKQRRIVEHFEDNRDQLREPGVGDLVAALRGLKMNATAGRSQSTDHYDDAGTSEHSISVRATNGDLPDGIVVALPIFRGGSTFEIKGRIYVHTSADKMELSYRLVNLDRAIERQLEIWREEIASATGLFVYR